MSSREHLLIFSVIFFAGMIATIVHSFVTRARVRRAVEEANIEPLPLDTRIPMSKTKRLAIAFFFLGSGVYGFFFVQLGTGFKVGVAVLGLLGAAILVLMLLGKAASGWIEFSSGGLQIGDGSDVLYVPWDRVKTWRMGEIALNAAVFITLTTDEIDATMTGDADGKFIEKTRAGAVRNLKTFDAHIILQITIYSSSPAAIVATFKRYAPMAAGSEP